MPYPNGKKSFAELDLNERYEWHASVYAFRHVRLGLPIERGTSPCDPAGEYFDETMIAREVAKLRATERRPATAVDEDLRREGRAICNAWARQRDFVDFPAAERAGHTIVDVIRSIGMAKRIPGEDAPEYDLANLQHDLGLGAKEYRPTADDMRDGRAALGIPEPGGPVFIEPEQERTANG